MEVDRWRSNSFSTRWRDACRTCSSAVHTAMTSFYRVKSFRRKGRAGMSKMACKRRVVHEESDDEDGNCLSPEDEDSEEERIDPAEDDVYVQLDC